METHRYPNGYRPGPEAGSPDEIDRLLAHLEQRLVELDRLHREIAEDAQALAHAATTPKNRGGTVDGAGARSVYSVRAAATELGVSVSMLHKLLKQRRLGHLKVGARTLITAEHLQQFREASEAPGPESSAGTFQERALTAAQTSLMRPEHTTRTAASASVATS
ncbi:MAG: hypothetical protein JWR20_1555 [Marmoricola sp.]|nr:hypothetical protein [Marmoricola sp.]